MAFKIIEHCVVAEGFLKKSDAESWASKRLIEDECQHWTIEEVVEDDEE